MRRSSIRGPERDAGNPLAPATRPSTHRPGRSPSAVGEHPSAGGREERVIVPVDAAAYPVHCVGDLVMCMAREIFIKRCRVDFASGPPSLRGRSLGAFENVVGDRYGRFHTGSIPHSHGQRSRGFRTRYATAAYLRACGAREPVLAARGFLRGTPFAPMHGPSVRSRPRARNPANVRAMNLVLTHLLQQLEI